MPPWMTNTPARSGDRRALWLEPTASATGRFPSAHCSGCCGFTIARADLTAGCCTCALPGPTLLLMLALESCSSMPSWQKTRATIKKRDFSQVRALKQLSQTPGALHQR